MGFLNQLLKYKNICIQCHNSPDADALAAAYGVYTYLKLHDINVSIIYSGDYEIQKKDLLYMIDLCEIPVEYVKELPKTDLLLLVDGQYGRGNVYRFEADNIAMIDHHMPSMKKTENAFIDYSYQSCSTIVWELLKEEGYDVKANEKLSIAFLYGLYTDTSSYVDLYKKHDIAMRDDAQRKPGAAFYAGLPGTAHAFRSIDPFPRQSLHKQIKSLGQRRIRFGIVLVWPTND